MKAYQVIKAWVIYKDWLSSNGLEDDSKEITVKQLLDYVQNHIDEEYKEQYKFQF